MWSVLFKRKEILIYTNYSKHPARDYGISVPVMKRCAPRQTLLSEEIQMNKWAGYMARSRETRSPYRVLVRRTEGKSTL
jgi:hypothetical protein